MALMNAEVYDALRSVQVPEDKARAAAESVVNGRMAAIEQRFAAIEERLTKVERDLAVMKWMLGANLALSIAILVRLFTQ